MRRAILMLGLCQLVWSFGGVVICWEPLPQTLMASALLVSGAVLAVLTPRHRLRLPNNRLRLEAIGFGIANGATNALMAAAITLAGIGNAAFAYASLPLWMVLIARPILGDRVPTRALPAMAIGAAGIILLLMAGRGSSVGENVLGGLALALIAAIAGSVSALAGRRLVPRVGVDATATWTMFVGGLVLIPLVDWRAFGTLVWWMIPTLLAWVGIHYILAPVTYNRASVSAPAFVIAVATFVNPAISPVWGALFYGEHVSALAVAGLCLALGANLLLMLTLRSTRTAEAVADEVVVPAIAA
ncbi:MAG: DMT family transporter [Thermomicrobiales bacterium]|nr:DMT family transporter [Thermomicrobiales bacterium]